MNSNDFLIFSDKVICSEVRRIVCACASPLPRLGSFFSFRGPLTSSNEQARAGKDECLLIIVYLRSINFGIGGHCFRLPPFSPQLSKLFYLSCVSTFQKQKFKQKIFHIFLFTHLSLCLFDSLNCAPWVGFVGRGKLALTYYKLGSTRFAGTS